MRNELGYRDSSTFEQDIGLLCGQNADELYRPNFTSFNKEFSKHSLPQFLPNIHCIFIELDYIARSNTASPVLLDRHDANIQLAVGEPVQLLLGQLPYGQRQPLRPLVQRALDGQRLGGPERVGKMVQLAHGHLFPVAEINIEDGGAVGRDFADNNGSVDVVVGRVAGQAEGADLKARCRRPPRRRRNQPLQRLAIDAGHDGLQLLGEAVQLEAEEAGTVLDGRNVGGVPGSGLKVEWLNRLV